MGKRQPAIVDLERTQRAATFGALLIAARVASGKTQRAVAMESGVSLAGVKALEHGRFLPTILTAERLAGALGLDPCELMEDPPNDNKPRRRAS